MTATVVDVAPALYCGTYAKYNNGSIDGRWLRLADHRDAEAFLQACRELHADEADPEFMFQDFEGFPRELYGESMSLVDLRKLYDWMNLPDDDRELLSEYLDAASYCIEEVDMEAVHDKLFCILDHSHGWDDNARMGWYALDEGLVEVPEHLQSYIDVEALGRDWLMDFSISSNGYVFEV
jgi:antirestriction protein